MFGDFLELISEIQGKAKEIEQTKQLWGKKSVRVADSKMH